MYRKAHLRSGAGGRDGSKRVCKSRHVFGSNAHYDI